MDTNEILEQANESVKNEPKGIEEVLHLTPVEIHNSIGCKHYFIQKSSREAECNRCGLGVNATVEGGKIKRKTQFAFI